MYRSNFFINLLIDAMDFSVPLVPFESPYRFAARKRKQKKEINKKQYYTGMWKLQKRGVIKIVEKNGQKFLALTKNGELELLLKKSQISNTGKWDGKWRVLIFDIPEDAKRIRDNFRKMLKNHNFSKLQASVFISPYPLNTEGLNYLKESGLMDYIRILRVDEIDNDSDLRKKFGV